MKRADVWLTVGWWAFIGLASGIPALVGLWHQGPDQVYLGRIPITAADTGAYFSNIEQVRQGQWLLSNQFTSQPQTPSLFHPLWLVLGWLGSLFHLATPVLYQVARLLAWGGLLWLLWRLLAKLFPPNSDRLVAIALITTSSGLGWIWRGDIRSAGLVGALPIDQWVAESNTFLSIHHSALFIVSQALLLAVLWGMHVFFRRPQWSTGGWIAAGLILLALVHPYDVVTAGIVGAALLVITTFTSSAKKAMVQKVTTWVLGWVLVVGGAALYYWQSVMTQPAMAEWLRQNVDTTGSLPFVLLGYGLLWPLAAIGVWQLWRGHRDTAIFLAMWILVSMVLIYLPQIAWQRRLLNGLHLPIAILSAVGLRYLWSYLRRPWWRGLAIGATFVLLAASNIRVMVADSQDIVRQTAWYPVYQSVQEQEAMEWLRAHSTFADVILSEVWTGNALPGVTGRTVVLGHGHQTIDLQDRLRDWQSFTQDSLSPAARQALLQRLRVTVLWWRQQDADRSPYQPGHDPLWQTVFTNNRVTIFRLTERQFRSAE